VKPQQRLGTEHKRKSSYNNSYALTPGKPKANTMWT